MTTPTTSLLAGSLLAVLACGDPAWGEDAAASNVPAQSIAPDRLSVELINEIGEVIGEVAAREGAMGVLLQVRATDLPSGFHGLHLHATGDCSDLGAFKRSGGHIQHTDHAHGYLHTAGVHRGDLPNLYAHTDGVASADFFAAELALSDLRDADGAALIVHAEPDNYWTQPIGAAGDRIACAAFAGGTNATMNHAAESDDTSRPDRVRTTK